MLLVLFFVGMCCSKLKDSAYSSSDIRVYEKKLLIIFFTIRCFVYLYMLFQNVVYQAFCCELCPIYSFLLTLYFYPVAENNPTNESNFVINVVSVPFQLLI